MKIKNILKTGIFSIIILSLLISPILKSNISEVKAQNVAIGPNQEELKEYFEHFESSSEDLCAGVGENGWTHILELAWWEHVSCVIQKSIIAALGTSFSAMVILLIKWIMWAFSPATYGGFSTNTAVLSVWKSMRNLVNLFLALGLVFIAIATILGIKKYSWQQTLWKLVVVALLVNFSLVMAGMILDVSHFFAYSFLTLAKGDNQVIGESLIKSFETEKLDEDAIYSIPGIDTITPKGTKGWGLSWGNALILIIILLTIIVFTFISLLSVFAAMIIRSFIIVALLCLSPIAFASWIFPDTEKLWKIWWQQFIKWCTYPIIFALMLWIGISVVINIEPGSSAEVGAMASIIRIILFSMFLIGGLIFSVQGGGATAQFVMKQGSKVRSAVGALVSKGIKGSQTYAKIGQKLTQVPIINTIGYKMLDQYDMAQRENLRNYEKNYENRPKKDVENVANGLAPNPLNKDAYQHYIAAVNVAARHGWLTDQAVNNIKAHADDPRLDVKAITTALPEYFRIVSGKLEEVNQLFDQLIDQTVQNIEGMGVGQIGAHDHRERSLNHIIDQAKKQSLDPDDKRDKFFQSLSVGLRPEQLAAYFNHTDPTEFQKQGLGGINGKVIQAIEKNTMAWKSFVSKLNSNKALKESLGISDDEAKSLLPPPPTPPTTTPPPASPPGPPPPGMSVWHPISGSPKGGFWTP